MLLFVSYRMGINVVASEGWKVEKKISFMAFLVGTNGICLILFQNIMNFFPIAHVALYGSPNMEQLSTSKSIAKHNLKAVLCFNMSPI